MSLKLSAIRASFLLSASDAVGFGCSLVRNMILARVLAKADFGIAATLAMVISLLEFSARMGVAQCVVRDKEGNDPRFVSTAHLLQFSVAAGSGALMLAAAWPLAHLFDIPGQAWAVASLALVALMRGCEHMDIHRFTRELRFGPASLSELIPQVAVTAAAWPTAVWLGDYRAVLVLLWAKTAIGCACTHAFAERRYSWSTEWRYMNGMLRFGWPLILNGFLMFGVMQGEQFVIASVYAMSELAPYAAAASLALMPVFFFGRVFNAVLLPLLAAVQDDAEAFRRRYRQVLAALTCLAGSCSVGFILGGETIMQLVYGARYAGAGVLLAGLGTAGALRTVRASTALAALAKGDSRNELYSNGARLVGLLPAIGLAWMGEPIWKIAYCGVLGEAAALLVSIVRLRRRDAVPLGVTLVPTGWVVLLMALATFGVHAGAHQFPTTLSIATAVLAAAVSAITIAVALPDLRLEALALRRRVGAVGWVASFTLRGR